MADAKITITADAQQAAATLEELRGVAREVFAGVTDDVEKNEAAAEAWAQTLHELQTPLSTAKSAAQELKTQVNEEAAAHRNASGAVQEQSLNLKDLTKSVLGGVSVIAILKANLDDLRTALEPAGQELRGLAETMGMDSDSATILTNTLESLVNPFTIVENLTANLKISAEALARALYDEASAADAASEAQQRKAGVMASVLSEQQKLVEQEQRGTESLERRTEALYRQISVEQQSGEVKKFYLDKLKAVLDEYEKRGEVPPEKVKKLADSLGVLAVEQEKAAVSAGKEADEQNRSVEAHDKLIPALEAVAKGREAATATVDDSIRALKEEIALYEKEAAAAQKAADEAQGRASDAAKRIAELESKPVLTLDEQNELNNLKQQQVQLDGEAADAAEQAAAATFEYGEAQATLGENTSAANESIDYAAGVMAELEAATADYSAAIQTAGDSTASANEIIETVGENGERKFTNLAEAAGEYGDVLVQVGEDGAQSITNAARAADKIPDALDKIGPAAEKAGEGLASLDESLAGDGEGGFAKTAGDIDKVNTGLERTHELARLIRLEFQRINSAIGGGGAGQ